MGVEQSSQQVQDPQILEKFLQLFDEPQGLPPICNHDHKIYIPLLQGAGLVS
jgi:hypothetical protein